MQKTALVAGASGLAGRAMVDHLLNEEGYTVLALARRANEIFRDVEGVEPLACDLLDASSVAEALAPYKVNYLFYTAVFTGKGGVASFQPKSDAELRRLRAALRYMGGPARLAARTMPNAYYNMFHRVAGGGEADKNREMIKNVLDACRQTSTLEHVTLLTGGKYHGHHLGPRFYPGYQSPIEEHFPRVPGHNWYYAVEDYVADRQADDQSWNYTTLRPSSIMGFATGSPYNLGTSLAVYASIRKQLGQPLLLLADPACQTPDIEFSPADLIADMMLWSAQEPRCRNQAYNASYGARTCWRDVWQDIADYFDMPVEYAERAHCAGHVTRDYPETWAKMCKQYGTDYDDFSQVCESKFLDQQFIIDWDAGYSPKKSRAHGYTKSIDPRTMFHQLFDRLVEHRVIPEPKKIVAM